MRWRAGLLAGTLVLAASPAAAQLRVGLGGGVLVASTLVKDSLAVPLALRAAPGPLLALSVRGQLDPAHQIGVSLGVAWSSLQRRTDAEAVRIGRLSTWTPTVSLHRALGGSIGVRLAAGVIIYRPDHSDGTVFRSGSPTLPLAGVGLTGERSHGGITLSADLGYDAHRFATNALRDEGFRGEQLVHRVALTVSVSRAGRP